MTDSLKEYAELYRHEGPWCMAYIEAGTGTVDTLEAADVRPGHVRETLAGKGASKQDLEAIEEAVQPATGEPSPVARYILVRQGTVELNVLLPGPLVVPERISMDPVPDLLPLIRHRPSEYPYIVVEAARDNAEIRLHYAGKHRPDTVQSVQGSAENLKKVPSGGWSQGRFQHRTEEIWRRNANQVAEEIDRVVRSSGAKLLVLAGDIRARGLIQDQLSEASRELLSIVDSHTHTGGADQEAFTNQINERVALQWAAEQQEVLERLAEQQGQANPVSATGTGTVLRALQQAQVDVLIMNDQAFAGRQFLALGAEPWIATEAQEALGADVLGQVPATAALLRAAALTDARILLVPDGVLPDKADIAALLRWPTGPAVPSP